MTKEYVSCPWPKNSAGIPYMYSGCPWDQEFHVSDGIVHGITAMAVVRMVGPLDAVLSDVLRELSNRCQHVLAPVDYDAVRTLVRVLGNLHWSYIHTVIRICAAVAPNISLSGDTLEGMLQHAFKAGGITTVDDADTLMRGTFSHLNIKDLHTYWPEFDPEDLTLMRPHDGCVASLGPAWARQDSAMVEAER